MNHKKRFEQIETKSPEEIKRPTSLLERFHFQRKLELPGAPRERDPVKLPPISADGEKTDPGFNKTQRKPSPETQKELSTLAVEIEIAEERRLSKESQAKRRQIEQSERLARDLQKEMAEQRISKARTTLFWGVVIALIAIALIYFLTHSGGTGRGTSSGEIIFTLFIIIVSIFGRNRGRYDRYDHWGRY